jgi:hypothetical protein
LSIRSSLRNEALTTSNPKTRKGEAKGWLTAILHLAPSSLSGFNVCPWSDRCEDPCLNTAGRGAMSNIQRAGLRKTRLFFEDRQAFPECA